MKTIKKYKKIILFSCLIILIAGLAVVILEKLDVINLYKKSVVQSDPIVEVISQTKIDYTSPSQQEIDDPTINSTKNESSTNSQEVSPLVILITNAGQNDSDKSIYVGTMAQGTASGICNLQLLQNSQQIYSTQTSLIRQNTLYTCNGFNIDNSNIPTGDDITVNVTLISGNESVTDSQIIKNVVKL